MSVYSEHLLSSSPDLTAQQESLRSKVALAAENLHEQGLIGTFIHTTPLHSLEHLQFEPAVAVGECLNGGRTYLPTDEFRCLSRTGRITDHDVRGAPVSYRSNKDPKTRVVSNDRTMDSYDVLRRHLIHGIDPRDPAHLHWHIHREQATKQFRDDPPVLTRTMLLEKAGTDLRLSLDPIGREWTLCDWVYTQLTLNLPDHVLDSYAMSRARSRIFWRKLRQTINRLVTSETIMPEWYLEALC